MPEYFWPIILFRLPPQWQAAGRGGSLSRILPILGALWGRLPPSEELDLFSRNRPCQGTRIPGPVPKGHCPRQPPPWVTGGGSGNGMFSVPLSRSRLHGGGRRIAEQPRSPAVVPGPTLGFQRQERDLQPGDCLHFK